MMFVGDISLPFKEAISVINFPDELFEKQWIGNLEGALVDNSHEFVNQLVVFNDIKAVKALCDKFKFSAFLLANNHILDCGSLDETRKVLEGLKIPSVGAGDNLLDSSIPLVLKDQNEPFVLLNFGWDVIQCEVATATENGVNPLTKEHVIESFNLAKSKFIGIKIIVLFHWNYELEAYPQPRDRELAKYLIDNGAEAVIGGHTHRVGGIELYKNKPIVYSLGNWMFAQRYYNNGNITFPDFCNETLAFEYDIKSGKFIFHFFEYDKKASHLTYLRTEECNGSTMSKLSPFRGMSNEEYKKWYSRNRYHKLKGLPIYYWEDSNRSIWLKNKTVKFRDYILKIMLKYRSKKSTR